MKFLFWNTGGNCVDDILVQIIKHETIDVAILAEFVAEALGLLHALNIQGLDFYEIAQVGCKRIHVFSRFPPSSFKHGAETDYYTIKELKSPGNEDILMALVHFPSKLYMSESDQLQESIIFKRELEKAEVVHGNSNTIIVGDFNMNPFELGMISASAIHSLPCAISAKRGNRVVKGREYSMFYNPMWNLFGDNDNSPGTYYYAPAGHSVYFWNILDQVVLRPCLIDRFDRNSLHIVTRVADYNLVDEQYRPNISDHLPISFALNMERGF